MSQIETDASALRPAICTLTGMLRKISLPLSMLILGASLSGCSGASNETDKKEPQAAAETCAANEIICGQKLSEKSVWAKYAVYLKTSKQQGPETKSVGACTGVLIHPRVVLTAAHCFRDHSNGIKADSALAIFSGKPFANQGADLNNVERRRISQRIIIHENFRPRNETFPQPVNDILVELHQEATNDIALVILASDAPKEYSFVTEMSTRWNGNENVQIVSSDNTLYFLGFGFVSSSNAGDRSLKIMSQQLGEQRVSSIFHRSNEFVWNQKQGGKICHGDSGGPIYSRRADRRIVLVGINQLVYTKDDNSPACSEFGVGTAVAPYRSWIRAQLKHLNLKFDE